MKIGVFDSGIGGLSVVQAIQRAVPDAEILFKNDTANLPYGDKAPEELLKLVVPIFKKLETAGCEVIVIACNTVSTNLAAQLRELFAIPIVALEPMIKPASEATKTGVIAVCATPSTLKSERYKSLKGEFAKGITVLEPDCSDWALLIETDRFEEQRLHATIQNLLNQNADVIVLGCTHYHWIEEEIRAVAAGRAEILQPETAVVAQLKRVLAKL